MFRVGYSHLIVIGVMAVSTTAWAQDDTVVHAVVGQDSAPLLITRGYDVTLLTTERQHFPFSNGSPDSLARVHQFQEGSSGGGAGGGGFGGGGGGGGFFSAADGATQSAELSLKQQLEEQGDSILDLIVKYVARESWTNTGDGPGEITEVGNTLIVRQTESIHHQVAAFLKSLTTVAVGTQIYQIEAWWLPLTDPAAMSLKNILNGNIDEEIVPEKLTSLCLNESGYHGTLLCRERTTTNMASGKKTPVIIGSTPVVGTGAVGQSPVVQMLHLGLFLEARVTPVPDFLKLTSDEQESESVDLSFRTQVTGNDAHIQERSTIEKIDRYEVGEHTAAGTCRIRIGDPTIVASLTQISIQQENSSESPSELQLVVRVTRIDE